MADKFQQLRCGNKVAIVTGGVQGIGKACVDILADNGATVVIFDIQDDVGSKLTTDGPGQITYMHCNVTKEDDVQNCIEETVRRFEKIDILVNNVGWHPGFKSVDELSVQGFRDLLDLNLVSCFAVTKFALPHLRKVSGSIINISSNIQHHGCRNSSTYIASKGGITALTKALAVDEAKHGIRVNSIAPGPVRTALFDSVVSQEDREKFEQCIQLGRLAAPQDIARACLYLAVDATFSTGTELLCTGGSDLGYGVKDRDGTF